ncbi:MAG: thioesterase family protein [Pseudomonadota bacterium]
MALLEQDTHLTGGTNGLYHGTLSEDWRIWSPNGGYLMAMVLRAAGLASDWPKPLSIMCQFLTAGQFAPVELQVTSLRKTRVAEALRISMMQGDRPLVESLVWTGDIIDGLTHDFTQAPEAPEPSSLKRIQDLIPPAPPPYPFFENYEFRPIDFIPFEDKENHPPYQKGWYRFEPEGSYADPYINAGRYLILLDTFGWTAASQAHRDDGSFMAPTLSLSVDFHRFDECAWLLSNSSGELAEGGLISVRNQVWSEERKLLASAAGTLFCRKRPGTS